MTDERLGDALWHALDRLPRGSGVVFRHYATPKRERRALFARVRQVAQRRGLVVLRAGDGTLRGEAGTHNQPGRAGGLRSFAAHTRREAIRAQRLGADVIFASPVFASRSHPHVKGLGPIRLGLMTRGLSVPVVALGGLDPGRQRRLRRLGLHGWAAIDFWGTGRPRSRDASAEAPKQG